VLDRTEKKRTVDKKQLEAEETKEKRRRMKTILYYLKDKKY
jgi:hypothetical protein